MVIGYNLCYSTIMGRLEGGFGETLENHIGVDKDFITPSNMLIKSSKNTIITPNGVLFTPKKLRKGILPLILNEILQTRIMVKKAMKEAKNDSDFYLEKVLNARQLALKLLANVTYGYTAAGFSGRMPCCQLADSIVQVLKLYY